MQEVSIVASVITPTLQDVLDKVDGSVSTVGSRRRDLRSAVISYSKLVDRAPSSIALDLAAIRCVLDDPTIGTPQMSSKRRANLRSDLASVINASGLLPMLRTRGIELDPAWAMLLQSVTDLRIRNGLSRFARWASAAKILPGNVSGVAIQRFVDDLEAKTLVRNMSDLRRSVISAWNALAALEPDLPTIASGPRTTVAKRIPWESFPTSFYTDVQDYLTWCQVPDAFDDRARARKLAPGTVRLRRDQVHSAATAAVAAGIASETLISLKDLVGLNTFRTLLRQLYEADARTLTAYTHGVAGTLISIAFEWTGASTEEVAALKKLRGKLGALPSGLTPKNKSLMRRLDDTRLLEALVQFPDKLWRKARKDLARSKHAFIDLQTALAIDILLVVPLRMKNLSSLNFRDHLHWPHGRGRAAMVTFGASETKNGSPLEFELPASLADRIWLYRNEIAPVVTGKRPDVLFVTTTGRPRTQEAITNMIEKAVLKNVGLKLTPHQFRHLAAKVVLDANPSAFELVTQLLAHKNSKTTTNFYAGIDTLRAGRAHTALVMDIRDRETMRATRQRRSSTSRSS